MSSKIALRKICSVIFAFFLAAAVFTGCGRDTGKADLEKGLTAYQNSDFKTAAKHFKAAAEKGNAEAQYCLAVCYARGNILESDSDNLKISFDWMSKAAEQGHTKAQCLLGIYYETGLGVEKDSEEAQKWFKKSIADLQKLAEQGDVDAQSCLSSCYENGFGIEKNEEKAFEWLRKAAERGDASSQLNLGGKYLKNGNMDEAVVWLRKAAEQGSVFAQITLGNIFEVGMDSIKPDKAEAEKWFRKAAESNDALFQKAAGDALKRLEAEPPAPAGN